MFDWSDRIVPLLASTRQSQNITVIATASGLARAVGQAWYHIGQACRADRGAHVVPRLCHSMSAHRIRDDTGWCCRGPARRLARVAVVGGKSLSQPALLRLSAMISQYFTRATLWAVHGATVADRSPDRASLTSGAEMLNPDQGLCSDPPLRWRYYFGK